MFNYFKILYTKFISIYNQSEGILFCFPLNESHTAVDNRALTK